MTYPKSDTLALLVGHARSGDTSVGFSLYSKLGRGSRSVHAHIQFSICNVDTAGSHLAESSLKD